MTGKQPKDPKLQQITVSYCFCLVDGKKLLENLGII